MVGNFYCVKYKIENKIKFSNLIQTIVVMNDPMISILFLLNFSILEYFTLFFILLKIMILTRFVHP